MEKILYQRFICVRDNFYDDPGMVAGLARHAEYFEPENAVGFRSRTIHHEPGIREKLQRLLGIKICYWGDVAESDNGVFYRTYADETPGIHYDQPFNDITVLIYLTPGLPADCGTSLWRHKPTGLADPPTPRDARKLKTSLTALRHTLALDSKRRSRWCEIDRIGYQFNRMVAYPSGAYHSATAHYGSPVRNGRFFQAFRIGVDWSTFAQGAAPAPNQLESSSCSQRSNTSESEETSQCLVGRTVLGEPYLRQAIRRS